MRISSCDLKLPVNSVVPMLFEHSDMTHIQHNAQTSCQNCGLTLPRNAPAGLCPACLLRAVMGPERDTGPMLDFASDSHAVAMDPTSTETGARRFQHGDSITDIDSGRTGIDDYPSTGTTLRYFGDYELHEEIARGGMGVVYRARQVRLNRQVALKMIRAGKFSSGTEIQRLRVEAEAAAQLDHPAIVPVFEVGEHEGLHYFTMAFVEGETLSAKLSNGPMPVRAAAKLMQTVAEAVAYAHEKGVIHRDIKPGNILIDSSGQPRVSDFGLAKQVTSDNELTTTGQILGTPSYMPPEQALGKADEVGRSSDIYSLGGVLYAAITGRPPFQAATSVETLRLVVEQQPLAPRLLNPSIPRDLETICLKCLEKSISRRYLSAKDVAEELQRFHNGDPILAQPAGKLRRLARWYRRHWAVATTGLSILLTVSTVAGVLGLTASRLKSELTKTAKAESAERKANQDAQGRLWIAYLNEANAQHRSRQSGQRLGALRSIRKAMEILTPAGRSVDELRTAASAALCLPDLEVEKTWPHSSRHLQFAVNGELSLFGFDDATRGEFIVRDTRTNESVMRLPLSDANLAYRGPQFSPDSQLLVYAKSVDGEPHLHLWRVGNNEPIVDLGKDAHNVAFRPDSRQCAVADINGLVRIIDCQTLVELVRYNTERTGPTLAIAWNPQLPQLAVMDLERWEVIDVERGDIVSTHEVDQKLEGWPAWDPWGTRLSMGAQDHNIGIWDSTTKELSVAPIHGHLNSGTIVKFSPDGNRLVSNDWNGIMRLWDTRTGQQLLSVPANGAHLQFSADGSYLMGDCTPTELRIFRYESGNEFRSIWEYPGRDSQFNRSHSVPCVSRSGRILAIRTSEGLCLIDLQQDAVVCRLSIADNGPFRFHETPDGEALWTYGLAGLVSWPVHVDDVASEATIGPPERLVYIAAQNGWGSSSGGETILSPSTKGGWLWNRKTRELSLLPHEPDVRACAVSSDGRLGVTGSHTPQATGVIVWNLETQTSVAELPVPGLTSVVLSPDGKWLVTNGDGTRIWTVGDWQHPRRIRPIKTHPCFSPDSQLLALSDEISVIRLVEPASGRDVAVLTAPERTRLMPIAFTPDGARLIAHGEETGALHIFDLRAIRRQLAEMKLDWDLPPLPPETESVKSATALKFAIDMGAFPDWEASRDALSRGLQLEGEGKVAEAIAECRRAVELDSRNSKAQNHLAWVLLVGAPEIRNAAEALIAATAAVAEVPNNANYLNTLGVALYRAEKWDDAIVTLNKSVLAKGSADGFDSFFLAMSHWQRSEREIARDWLGQAISWMDQNGASDPELIEIRREAESLVVLESPKP